ncbi:DNA polymerase I [Paludicola sp. MB14-C6]|uniref:DNA polymerase I n=1 Tax=Paludihabitans sp. MB14-C6 TaxID=3070656 RepID=UPI0027DC59AB|nr:DNA polymerase I [Paludicola sp. MB14-C6]WMJ22363.1 DNA polymerase I [Paludicola sp. MB14-C6]
MKLLAVDGNSILNRAFYGVRPLTTKEGIHTNAIFGFLNILMKLERELEPNAVAIAFDVSRKTFRNEQYAEYKANRKGMPEELAQQLPYIKEILSLMGYVLVMKEGYEGDDILGTLALECTKQVDWQCVVATGDRDCLQLVNDDVCVSLAKTKENILYTPNLVEQDFGVTPTQIIELKALMGDSSDNIPGVRGIGEKTAVTLIQKNKNIDKIYEDVQAIEATPRVKKLLEDGKENAFLSRQLATICCEVPIDLDLSHYHKQDADIEQLSALMTKLEMFSFFEKLNLTNTFSNNEQATETISFTIKEHASLEDVKKAMQVTDKLFIIYNEEQLLINIHNTILVIAEELEQVLSFLGQNNIPIQTFMAKPLIKAIKCQGFDDVNLSFDLELAAYLLSPSSKGYDLKTLANRHLGMMKFDIEEQYLDIAYLPYLCKALEQELKAENMWKLYLDIELPLCEVLADMEIEGFAIDVNGVEKFGKRLENDIAFITNQIYSLAGEKFNINSTKELGNILFEKLGLPAKKKTKTGYSTNVEVLESLMDKHEIIPAIMEYRKMTKLQSTYVVGLLKVVGEDKRVHSTFNQTETRTGRISSTEPNVQNIPVRTPLGSEIRKFFVARDGFTLVDADYSQIELRILAHIANDQNMINAFLHGDDIHAMTASQVFHCPMEEMTSELRSRAKAINFGIVYGIGAYSLSQDINVSVAEAKAYINAYLETYSGVANYMKNIIEQAQKDGFVTTLYGRKRDLADINATNKMVKAFAERVALNTPIQGTAADIIKLAMIKVHARIKKEGLDARLILQVHDELIVEAPTIQAPMIKAMLKEEMESAAKLHIPLLVDAHNGENWYVAKG